MSVQTVLPRWRGFNLCEAMYSKSSMDFLEEDFALIAEWGFNFVRLPLCYWLWTRNDDPMSIDETKLVKIDRAVNLGRQYGLHVCLNFHRGPGYCVNGERKEPFNLWKDEAAQAAFCLHWQHFAQRYRSIPSEALSFNLLNEPEMPTWKMTRSEHARVMRRAVATIREVDPTRLIILDGLSHATIPCPDLADLPNVAQSCRAYMPGGLSHYKADWVQGDRFPLPTWPGGVNWDMTPWGRTELEMFYEPWGELAKRGVGVHCGEGGAFIHTPHQVVLAWLRDVLEILTAMNIGMALWNFRGGFGVLDTQRSDVAYEDFHGHKLDRKLLELLREF